MSTVSGTRRAARRQSHDGSADKVLVTLEATPPVAGNLRGAPTPVPAARNSPIDVEAIEDEVQAVSPSRVPPPRRNRRTRREPITAVDLEVEVIWAGNKRQRVQRLSPDVGAGSSLQRLRAALRHLQVDAGVLERLVYKHRNQHRGAAYFQYLLKVRRDLKLLLGAGLAEVLNAVFPVLACHKPANTILVPAMQTKKKPGANHSHHERLLGVARLLSQMSEPVMKAAIQITFLLARSFFVDLCTAVFSLLARVRVLIQQMLLDVVSIYNKVTDLTDRNQAVKISISGVQAFREYYPSMNDACTILECVWVKDKFVLHEKVKDICQETQVEDQKCCDPESSIQYDTVAMISEDMKSLEETNPPASQPDASLAEQPDKMINCNDAGDTQKGRQLENETSACSVPDTLSTHEHLKPETRKRVAFVAVGNPKAMGAASGTKSSEVNKKQRLDMISPSNIQSGLYNKLLDCETTENTIL